DRGRLAAPDGGELGGKAEPDAVKAGAGEQGGERARAAAEIDHARAGLKLGELDERVDEARARLRREHVVVVRGGVAVEERDLLLLVLRLILHQGRHFRIGSDLVLPGLDPGMHRKKLLMRRMYFRVKPGNDAVSAKSLLLTRSRRICAPRPPVPAALGRRRRAGN